MLDKLEGNIEGSGDKKYDNQDDVGNSAMIEMEDTVAAKSEEIKVEVTIPMLDYDTMDFSTLNLELDKLIKNYPIQDIKSNVDAIKNTFNSKFKLILEEKKESFLTEGGNIIDFSFSSPEKIEFNKLISDYKKIRNAFYASLEKQLKDNLEKRNAIIEELKSVIEKADPKTMYNEYKSLNDRWRLLGAVPRDRYNDVWKVYHHHVERFYDLLHLNKNFRELDFKHNLEEKLKIIARAEELSDASDVNSAFVALQDLHRVWKEEVGPVAKEHRESIWEQFSNATKKLHDRRHEFFKIQREKTQVLIDQKLKVVDLINSYDYSNNKSHRDWQNSIKDIDLLRKKYFDLGKLPYSKSESVWQELKKATQKFNVAKNNFYRSEKKVQNENLKKKMVLVELAESLKESEEWEETIKTLQRIQNEWKKIGHVPHKFSDDVWKRFKSACNHFFSRLTKRNDDANKERNEVIVKKKAYLDVFKAKEGISLEEVKTAILEWRDLGVLPKNSRFIDTKFNKAIDTHLEKQDMTKFDIEMLKFKNVVDSYLAQEDFRKLDGETLFVRKKIDETVKEMKQLENNLGFISNASKDSPLVKNIYNGIEDYKATLALWKSKLQYLKDMDY